MNAVINENNKVWVEVLMGIVFYLGLKVTYHFITNRYIADDILGLLHWIGYYPFFMMGYLWNKYNCSAFRFMSEKWIGVLLLLFSTIYGCLVVTNDINNFCISFSLSFVIILGLFLHFKNFHTSNLIGKGLSLLGRYSLVIYLTHYIVLHCFSISRPLALLNENLYIPLGLVFTIIIALLVSFMCIGSGMLAKKYKFIGAILYGEKI